MGKHRRTASVKCANGRADEIIGGRRTVLEALRYGKPDYILVAEEAKKIPIVNEISSLALKNNIPLIRLPRDEFDRRVAGLENNQGIAAALPPYEYRSLEKLITISKNSSEFPFFIMLDHVEDPHNLGAIIRTACAAGVDGLIIPNRRAASVTAAVRKVASGTAERFPVAMVSNLTQTAQQLKNHGFWIYGTDTEASDQYYDADYRLPLVLIIGSEAKGISRLLRRECDRILSIPMPGDVGSLNASVAAAVLIYGVLAQRKRWTF